MQFLQTGFLLALLTLSIPILIHLFYFRRYKKVYFSNVRFLKEIKEESSIRSRLKNILTLLARLLALGCLVLAFAQPFLPKNNQIKQGRKTVAIFIDNSNSMSSLDQSTNLLEVAKKRAETIVRAYANTDYFIVTDHNLSPSQQRILSQEQALTRIQAIEHTSAASLFSTIWNKQQFSLEKQNADHKILYWISDFQKTISDFPVDMDTTVELNLIPIYPLVEQNVAIDSCWFEAPAQLLNQSQNLFVSITNFGSEEVSDVKISTDINGRVQAVSTIDIESRATYIDTISVTPLSTDWQQMSVNISDYPIQFDDRYHISYPVFANNPVLVISADGINAYLEAALEAEEFFAFEQVDYRSLDYSQLSKYKLIVLEGLSSLSSGLNTSMTTYISNGGNVLIFPSKNANLDSYNGLFSQLKACRLEPAIKENWEVGRFNTDEFTFKDVFSNELEKIRLPSTQLAYPIRHNGASVYEDVLTYRNGYSFLSKYTYEKGNIYICAAPLDTDVNNLVQQAEVFLPMLYKMSVARTQAWKLAYTIGENESIVLRDQALARDETVEMIGSSRFIPAQRSIGNSLLLQSYDQVKSPGFFSIENKTQDQLALVAFNQNRNESDLTFYSESDLENIWGENATVVKQLEEAQLAQLIRTKNEGTTLWRLFLILALVFLALEILIIRLWKA